MENVTTKVVRSGGSAVVTGCVHATTLMKLALVESVDDTLKKLPPLFAAVTVDDTQFQTVGKSHQVSQQLQRVIRLFTEHAESSWSHPRSWMEIITNDERIRRRRAKQQSARGCPPHVHEELGRVDYVFGGKRTGAKVVAIRAKRFRVKMTFLKRLSSSGSHSGKACQDRHRPSLTYGSDSFRLRSPTKRG